MMGLLVSKAFDTVLIANEANAAYLCGENPKPLDTMRAARMAPTPQRARLRR
jgi:hypothetical protein